MMVLTRSPLLVMMSVRRRSCGDSCGRLGQQLRSVAHGADRVADLVSDARAEPAERSELRLLDALDDQRRVLQEHQRRSLPLLSSDTKCGWTRLPPSEASMVSVLSCQSSSRRRQVSNKYSRRGETSPTGVPCGTLAPCSSSAADSLIRRMVSFASTTRMLCAGAAR